MLLVVCSCVIARAWRGRVLGRSYPNDLRGYRSCPNDYSFVS